MLNPSKNKNIINDLKKTNKYIFSLELLPRITRAQSMDVLSSQSNLAGYRAVIDSIFEFEKAIPNDDDSSRNSSCSKSFSNRSWGSWTSSYSYS